MADARLPFTGYAGNMTIAVTNVSGSIGPVADTGRQTTLRVCNVGASEAFMAVSSSNTVVAVAGGSVSNPADGSLSIPAGSNQLLTCGEGEIYIAAVCAGSNTTTLRLARGQGGT